MPPPPSRRLFPISAKPPRGVMTASRPPYFPSAMQAAASQPPQSFQASAGMTDEPIAGTSKDLAPNTSRQNWVSGGRALAVKRPAASKRPPPTGRSDSSDSSSTENVSVPSEHPRSPSYPPIATLIESMAGESISLGAAPAESARAAGAQAAGIAGTTAAGAAAAVTHAAARSNLPGALYRSTVDYDVENVVGTSLWIPEPTITHFEPDDGSPAAALRATRQIWFLDALSSEPAYTDMLVHPNMVRLLCFILFSHNSCIRLAVLDRRGCILDRNSLVPSMVEPGEGLA